MKIRQVHTLLADWLLGVRIKTYIVSVLETYMTLYVISINKYYYYYYYYYYI